MFYGVRSIFYGVRSIQVNKDWNEDISLGSILRRIKLDTNLVVYSIGLQLLLKKKKINKITYFENLTVKLCVFYIYQHMLNFVLIRYYLLFDL